MREWKQETRERQSELVVLGVNGTVWNVAEAFCVSLLPTRFIMKGKLCKAGKHLASNAWNTCSMNLNTNIFLLEDMIALLPLRLA